MQEHFDLKDYESAEKQLLQIQRNIGFTLSEYPVEVLVNKMPKSKEDDQSDFQIPEYQRDFSWENSRQCKFIESVLMGLPIPFLFGYIDPAKEDRTIIVDGVQRLNTLKEFVEGRLALKDLSQLTALENFIFSNLSPLQQRRFLRRTLRMIILDETADPQTQFELFERINTGSKRPSPADIRRGAFPGPFRDLIVELSKDERFVDLTPMGASKVSQREREELVARLFCYADRYEGFSHDVALFINEYVRDCNALAESASAIIDQARSEFDKFCNIAIKLLPDNGFGLGTNNTPRNQFEALAVALLLAIREGIDVDNLTLDWIQNDEQFKLLTRSGGSNSRIRLGDRINHVRAKIQK